MRLLIRSKKVISESVMKTGELRIPIQLLSNALVEKKIKALRILATAKLNGHRSNIQSLCEVLKMHHKTIKRQIKTLVNDGMAGTDGTYLFPRSWGKMKFNKRGGLYLINAPKDLKKFEALCFAKGLKKILSRKASPKRPDRGRTMQNSDLPTTYLAKALGLKERRFKTLKSSAQRYKYISVIPQYRILGKVQEYHAIKKNLHDLPVFKRGKHTVVPDISKIRVLI